MLPRKLLQVLFVVLSILCVDLVVTYINNNVLSLKTDWPSEYVTLVGMVVVIVLFYFAIRFITAISSKILDTAMAAGRTLLGYRIGSVVAFLALFGAIFAGYHYVWFNSWPSWRRLAAPILGLF